jgi:DNA-directed RNA polymerase subunit RPC12/RpoP
MSQIPCPRCGYDSSLGRLERFVLKPTGEVVYICGECGAVWHEGENLKMVSYKFDIDLFNTNGKDIYNPDQPVYSPADLQKIED